MPRRYRGYDLIWWLSEMGLDQTPVEKRGPDAILPLITGAYGGHTIDLRAFAEQGIALLGRLRSAAAGSCTLPPICRPASPTATPPTAPFWTGPTRYVEQHGAGPASRAARPCQAAPIRPVLVQPTAALDLRAAGHQRGHLGNRLHLRLQLDRSAGAQRKRRADSPRRYCADPGTLFPWPALAVQNELVVPGWGRGRCGTARRPYCRNVGQRP